MGETKGTIMRTLNDIFLGFSWGIGLILANMLMRALVHVGYCS